MNSRSLHDFVETLPAAGSFSVWCGPLDGDAQVEHRATATHYAASTMKLALVVAAYRLADAGRLSLDRQVEVHNDFASQVAGRRFTMDEKEDSDPEPWRRMGSRVSLRWLALRSIVRSSNLATNLLLDEVGLPAVSEALDVAKATDSIVTRGIEDYIARDTDLHNLVTAQDLALTLRSLAAGTAATPESCREILDVLAAQQVNDAIPVGLPPGTKVAHKSGWVPGVSHDAGIVYPGLADPYVFVMCTTSELAEQESLDLIAAGAAASWKDWQAAS